MGVLSNAVTRANKTPSQTGYHMRRITPCVAMINLKRGFVDNIKRNYPTKGTPSTHLD